MKPPYFGGCQCGQVKYELKAEPIRLIVCHCKQCQLQSGSAFGMSMHIKKGSLKVSGAIKSFERIADSGNKNTGCFCPECGNRIYNIPHALPETLVLKPGTLDNTKWLKPKAMIWLKSAQGWVPVPPTMKTADEQGLSISRKE